MIPDLVEITWRDAAGDAGWKESDDLDLGDEIVVTVGFLVAENPNYIAIVHSRCPDSKEVTGFFQIPKCCIVEQRTIEKGKP